MPETEVEWAEAAEEWTVRDVERAVKGRLPGDRPDDPQREEAATRRLALDVSPETFATFREAVGQLRQETETPISDEEALLKMSRRVLGGTQDAGEASYAIMLTVCASCRKGTQHGRGEIVAVDAPVVEQAQCDARCFEVSSPELAKPVGASDEPAGRAHVGTGAPSATPEAKTRPRASQTIPPATRRRVMARDHGRCVVPGCRTFEVRAPRVNDKRVDDAGGRQRFTSQILPPYMRRSPKVAEVLPALYLRGLSTGDFKEALPVLLGEDTSGLSSSAIARLTNEWEGEYHAFIRRDLSDRDFVYVWADGIHFNVRLEDDWLCTLVVPGVPPDGTKELSAVSDGYRESKRLQGKAKAKLHEAMYAATRKHAEEALDAFEKEFGAKYPKAVEKITKDRESLLVFFDVPAEHWTHFRTTNVIESVFATVRLRQRVTKGVGSRNKALLMTWKLCDMAQARWRSLNRLASPPAGPKRHSIC